MNDIEPELITQLEELASREPRTCSIKLYLDHATVTIDQSLDVSIKGNSEQAREAVLFLFPTTTDADGITTMSVNKEFISKMKVITQTPFKACGEQNRIIVRFLASHDAKDIAHLMNAFRWAGGMDYFDKAVVVRHGHTV